MLRSLHMLALALVATLGSASSATAITAETALRAHREISQPRVTDFSSQAREAHQQTALGYGENASDSSLASREGARYLAPGVGAAARGQIFKHAWIKKDLFADLQRLAGKADFAKFKAALGKGVVGPTGESGVKILREPVRGFTHELKIGGSAQRLLGRIDENDVLVFEEFVRGGLH